MGFPAQERLMSALTARLQRGVFIGEGGSFDYRELGGHAQRAPAWMQRSGLEWFWRLLREPRRWRRQLAIPRFIWAVHRETRSHGVTPGSPR
jgi:N-acetylglucosaminyldiphosphoundecaprenol N-acetyl-beta-D-mannosaminyltransferase